MCKHNNVDRMSIRDRMIFITVTFIYWFSLFIYVPVLPPYIEAIGGTYTFVGIVLGSYGFMQLIMRLPIGILSDYMKARRPFIILGLFTGVFSSFGFAVTNQLGWALGLRAISGITAATWVAYTVLYSSFFTKEETIRAMSTMQFVMVAAQLTSMGINGMLVMEWGLKAPFLLGGSVGLVGLILSFFIKEPAGGDIGASIKIRETMAVISEPLLLKGSLLSIFAHCILFITMFGFTPSYALSIGASESELGFLGLTFLIPQALAAIVSGRKFVPLMGQWRTLTIGFLGSAFFTLIIPFVNDFAWLCLTQAFNGFALGLTFPLLMNLSIQAVPRERRATAMGFYQAVYAAGMFLGPLLAGWLNTGFGLKGGFILAAFVGFIATGLAYWNHKC